MAQFALRSLWSRLLATLAIVIAPVAVLVLALAFSLYGETLAVLRSSDQQTAAGKARDLSTWFEAAGRSLAGESAAAGFLDNDKCVRLARSFLDNNEGFASVRFFDSAGSPCDAGATSDFGNIRPARGERAYALQDEPSGLWLSAGEKVAGATSQSLLEVAPAELTRRLQPDTKHGELHVSIIGPNKPLASDGGSKSADWMPADKTRPLSAGWFSEKDATGQSGAYAMSPIGDTGLYLLARFEDSRSVDAGRRLLVLCAAQLAMLAVLAAVYIGNLRRDVVRWIKAIDDAARRHGVDPESLAKAPVASSMPTELKSVAQSFNAMADAALAHQHALRASLEENRALTLEMHHRIKNSLQVIQSYMALIRRFSSRAEAGTMGRIEVRVGVLATAYRLAMSPKGLRPILVKPFLEEILTASLPLLRTGAQEFESHLEWAGDLNVDRTIPLGLALVEGLIAAFASTASQRIAIILREFGDGAVGFTVSCDDPTAASRLPEQIVRGLSLQLGADARKASNMIDWRFKP